MSVTQDIHKDQLYSVLCQRVMFPVILNIVFLVILSYIKKYFKPGVVVHTYNISTLEAAEGELVYIENSGQSGQSKYAIKVKKKQTPHHSTFIIEASQFLQH